MSRAYGAKRVVLKAYPDNREDAINLFLGYLDISEGDFTYENNQTPEEYIFGGTVIP